MSYTGDWKMGVKHGQGKEMDSTTGASYEGGWLNGQKHGQGCEIDANGITEYTGSYRHGERVGSSHMVIKTQGNKKKGRLKLKVFGF